MLVMIRNFFIESFIVAIVGSNANSETAAQRTDSYFLCFATILTIKVHKQ